MIVGLRLFATAREAAGRSSDTYELTDGATLDVLLGAAVDRYGDGFAAVLDAARVWVNGEEPPSGPASALHGGDEVAVLPPVSGGAA
ncbi:MAG TPA: MoaD family protein [Acidimicrobiia bacterium]|nr:MoaD family protein [Acidimicrobiia bacterium]